MRFTANALPIHVHGKLLRVEDMKTIARGLLLHLADGSGYRLPTGDTHTAHRTPHTSRSTPAWLRPLATPPLG